MVRLILILTLISNLAFAQNAVHMNKGDIAEFEGDLLTLETTKQLYNDSLEKTSLQKQLDLTNSSNTLLQQDKNLLQTQNQKLVEAANSESHMSDLEKAGFFLLGVLVTGLAVKGAASLHP
jgi:hypothetical protein